MGLVGLFVHVSPISARQVAAELLLFSTDFVGNFARFVIVLAVLAVFQNLIDLIQARPLDKALISGPRVPRLELAARNEDIQLKIAFDQKPPNLIERFTER